jgi:hypothetical protein
LHSNKGNINLVKLSLHLGVLWRRSDQFCARTKEALSISYLCASADALSLSRREKLLLLWGGGMLVPWGEQAKAGGLSACGQLEVVSDLCQKLTRARTHRRSHFYFLAALAHYL